MTDERSADPGTVEIPADVEAVVYDLDGTLVRLAVDWVELEIEIQAVLRESGIEPGDRDAWELLDEAEAAGIPEVGSLIAAAERDGAHASTRLPLADDIDHGLPTAVCSLNCEAACRIALDTHDLGGSIGTVVGRDSVAERKPAPEPLLAAVEGLGARTERTLFVGDSSSDETTADRAGTRFAYVGDGPTTL
ncbi:HAD family hydrolase [Halococcus hamelinensis]|uniref:Phosphoglycolate phosphatase n=1 Tax=Halococcus hamelinensis 100A6 TaxID=1132509 RepID=M0M912_9EURY|nr:HAD hydrolase-like protein [Halococcus hamelinensis]EMA41099.1 phosphoglycolate phosphatase [Halococcus hamelinensis 100A6]